MRIFAGVCVSTLSCALLSGCGIGPTASSNVTVQGAAIHGVVQGGRQPIAGAKVYLLEASTTGYINHYQATTLSSAFNGPTGVKVDGNGNVFVADFNNNAVEEVLAVGGSIPASPVINPLGSGFINPAAVVLDVSGNVYVADSGNNAVKEMLAVGGSIPGSPTILTLGGGFSSPDGVAVDSAGNVFVDDFGNNAVKEIPTSCIAGANDASCVITLASVYTTGGGFLNPYGVALDRSGNVFVADYGHNSVKEILKSGGYSIVNTLNSGFNGPTDVALDGSGNIYVADDISVKEIPIVGGYATVSTVDTNFTKPYGVGVDDNGNVFVVDLLANNLVKETVSYSHQASKSLLTASTGNSADSIGYYVVTDSGGNWTINGDYACDANAQSYLYALGGDTGAGPNSAVALLATLGQCPGSSPFTYAAVDPFVTMNEVTTAAAAYAMAGYATDATHVSSNNTSLAVQGIANAFANAANLATLSNGTANTAVPNNLTHSTVPQSELNTLGNILAACVNSNGSASFECSTLFTNAQLNGSTGGQPTDIASAAINIAHNPANGVAALYGLQPAISAPFAPNLLAQPNDFTVALTFTGNGLNGPYAIALDGSGDAWVVDGSNSEVSVFTSSGGVTTHSPFSGNGLNGPQGIAIDVSGNAWVANSGSGGAAGLSEFTSSGGVATNSPFSGNGLDTPQYVAIDVLGNAWVTNVDSAEVSGFAPGGGVATNSPFSGNGLNGPEGIAIDVSGNFWTADINVGKVSEFTASGVGSVNSPFSGNGLFGPNGVAIDGSGNAWVANYLSSSGTNGISEFTASGVAATGSPFSGNGMNSPYWIAIDGSGNAWIANANAASLSEFSSGGSGLSPSGLGNAAFGSHGTANTVAIDGSGNVWTADLVNSIVIELVGAATPVVTPIVANLLSPYGAQAVNVP